MTSEHLTGDLAQRIKDRIHDPVVSDLFQAYREFRIENQFLRILNTIPSNHLEPIVHTLTTHVTKEKPVFIYSLGISNPENSPDRAALVAASIDLLWCFSLMYDDIFDGDQERAGKTTAWIEHGKEATTEAAQFGIDVLRSILSSNLGEESGRLMKDYILSGVESLEKHKNLNLESPREEILQNYVERARFHTTFPIDILSKFSNFHYRETATQALININLAGQILNDLKDMSTNYEWLRQGFSDIRAGVVTFPLATLWGKLPSSEQENIGRLFGSQILSVRDIRSLRNSLVSTGALEEIKSITFAYYQTSLQNFNKILKPELQKWPEAWVESKIKQLKSL